MTIKVWALIAEYLAQIMVDGQNSFCPPQVFRNSPIPIRLSKSPSAYPSTTPGPFRTFPGHKEILLLQPRFGSFSASPELYPTPPYLAKNK